MGRFVKSRGWRALAAVCLGALLLLHGRPLPAAPEETRAHGPRQAHQDCGIQAQGGHVASPGRQPLAEYQVKAAFLLKFASFVQWPSAAGAMASDPVGIAIVGNDPFGDLLPAEIPPEDSNDQAFRVTRLESPEEDLSRFRMIFLPQTVSNLAEPLLERVRGRPILTIGEGESFASQGGMIAFTLENKRVRFVINLAQAQKAGLNISSKLLNLARTVLR